VREILGAVDVERKTRVVADLGFDARRAGTGDRHGSRVGNAEGGREDVGGAKSERVHAAVGCAAEGDRARRVGELVEGLGRYERAIGHDNERALRRAGIGERLLDRVRVPRPRVD
jgi:hypothetical protein